MYTLTRETFLPPLSLFLSELDPRVSPFPCVVILDREQPIRQTFIIMPALLALSLCLQGGRQGGEWVGSREMLEWRGILR